MVYVKACIINVFVVAELHGTRGTNDVFLEGEQAFTCLTVK